MGLNAVDFVLSSAISTGLKFVQFAPLSILKVPLFREFSTKNHQ